MLAGLTCLDAMVDHREEYMRRPSWAFKVGFRGHKPVSELLLPSFPSPGSWN